MNTNNVLLAVKLSSLAKLANSTYPVNVISEIFGWNNSSYNRFSYDSYVRMFDRFFVKDNFDEISMKFIFQRYGSLMKLEDIAKCDDTNVNAQTVAEIISAGLIRLHNILVSQKISSSKDNDVDSRLLAKDILCDIIRDMHEIKSLQERIEDNINRIYTLIQK